jgi:hypothetical protein
MNELPSSVPADDVRTTVRGPAGLTALGMLIVVRQLLLLLVCTFLLATFVLYVWPSAYRYDHVTIDGDIYPVRIHRVTGVAEILAPDAGWLKAGEEWSGEGTPPGDSRI